MNTLSRNRKVKGKNQHSIDLGIIRMGGWFKTTEKRPVRKGL